MNKNNLKAKILFLFKATVSAGLLFYLIRQISIDDILNQYSKINTLLLPIAFILLFLQIALSSLKWKYILRSENIVPPYLFLLKSYCIGAFISLFLPTSFGGDIYRVYALKKYSLNLFQNTSSVLFDRLSGLFALCSISIISYTFFYKNIIDYRLLGLYILAVILFCVLSSERILGILGKIGLRILKVFISILESFNKYANDRQMLLKSLFVSFLFQNNIILIVKLYCIAMNIDISIEYLYMSVPLIYLTEALPITINGLGFREGAFVFFFLQAGYAKHEALAVAFLAITMRYLFGLTIGGTLFFQTLLFQNKKEKDIEPNLVDYKYSNPPLHPR